MISNRFTIAETIEKNIDEIQKCAYEMQMSAQSKKLYEEIMGQASVIYLSILDGESVTATSIDKIGVPLKQFDQSFVHSTEAEKIGKERLVKGVYNITSIALEYVKTLEL